MVIIMKRKKLIFLTSILWMLVFPIVFAWLFFNMIPSLLRAFSMHSLNNWIKGYSFYLFLAITFFSPYFTVFRNKILKPYNKLLLFNVFFISYFIVTSLLEINSYSTLNVIRIEWMISIIFGLGLMTFSESKFVKKTLYSLIAFVLIILTTYFLLPINDQFYKHKNYTGSVSKTIPEDLSLTKPDGTTVLFSSLYSKNAIVDIWNAHCSICYQYMPEFINLQNKYQDSETTKILSINIYNKEEDIIKSEQLLKQFDYNDLERYYISKEEAQPFGVVSFPKLLVFQHPKKIIFFGQKELFDIFSFKYLEE